MSSASRFSVEVEQEIADRYATEGAAKLAKEYKCCRATICNVAKRHGASTSRILLATTDKEKILAAYNQTKSAVQINRTEGYSITSIYRVLAEFGIERDGGKPEFRRIFNPQDELKIVDCYEKGDPLSVVGKKFDSSIQTIRNICLRHNVKLRPAGRAKGT